MPSNRTQTTGRRAGRPPAKTSTRRGRPSAGSGEGDLRERILDAAEEQFARHGYDGVSTRAIAALADTSSAMIHYYFDTKREFFDAVMARRANVINKERLDAMNDYAREAGDDVTVEGVIAAFLRPAMEKMASGGPGWRNYLSLVAWVGNMHEWGGEVMTRSFDPVIQRLVEIIHAALPDAKKEDLYWAYQFLSGALIITLSGTDRINRLSGGTCSSMDVAALEPRMVAFAAAGFKQVCGQGQGR